MPKEIVANPNWYLSNIDLDQSKLLFTKTDRAALSQASFLDARFRPKGAQQIVITLDEALGSTDIQMARPAKYIFHTAFCCSTLLARCLDVPGHTVALKEPEVLMTLANYKRTGHKALANKQDRAEIFKLVSHLLSRPFGDHEEIVIKPTNTVNNTIVDLMAVHKKNRAILLQSDLKSFLISLLKKGEEGRAFARNLFNIFALDSSEVQQLEHNQLMRMTDLQIAALTWHLQFEHYQDSVQSLDASQLKFLHCDRLIADPNEIIKKVIDCLNLKGLQNEFEKVIELAPLGSNSKTPEKRFTAQDRIDEHERTAQANISSLEVIIPWAEQLHFKHKSVREVGIQL